MISSKFLRFIVGFASLIASFSVAADKPNVVFVITDDQGYGDLSIHGNPSLKTPNLDALAKDSVRLQDYHVAPTCSPSRSAILTGHWTDRTGVWHTINGRSMLRQNEVTLGQIFKDGGYATGMFGKWHLGDNYPFRPEDRGFTEVLRHGGGGVGQTPDFWDNAYFHDTYFHNKKPEKTEGFCTDVYFEYAKKFIETQVAADKPFLAYISTNAPHSPNHAPPEFAAPYLDDFSVAVANFFGMVANIDHNVGEMRQWLSEKGLAENTIFIFTTDNGTAGGRTVFDGGMRGAKGSEYDGGHRVPFFIHWPNGNMKGGRLVEEITGHVDVVPTLIDLCDVPAPKGVVFDGTSIRPLLDDKVDADWPDRILVTDSQRVKDPIKWRKSSVMTSQWRLVSDSVKGKPRHELYDIKADPKQAKNVIAENPEAAKRLKKFYNDWWSEIEPTFGSPARIILGNLAENPTRLTSHDWITEGSTPWNQAHIRDADNKPQNRGFWYLEVETSGDYEIELRRWPNEGSVAKVGISEEIPPGAKVPGGPSFRGRPGKSVPAKTAKLKMAGQTLEAAVPEGAASVKFSLKLEKGPAELEATFHGENGEITGAYYAYVKKL